MSMRRTLSMVAFVTFTIQAPGASADTLASSPLYSGTQVFIHCMLHNVGTKPITIPKRVVVEAPNTELPVLESAPNCAILQPGQQCSFGRLGISNSLIYSCKVETSGNGTADGLRGTAAVTDQDGGRGNVLMTVPMR
jgi:hypothetical protein